MKEVLPHSPPAATVLSFFLPPRPLPLPMDAPPELVAAQPLIRLRFTKEVLRISVNATNSLAVLTGKKGLSVIGLTPPYAVARELIHPSRAPPVNGAWSPHASHASMLASHSGQSVHVWNLNDGRSPLQATLPHTRNVRGVAWATFEPTLLASCAADNAIHLWDLRELRAPKPTASFKVFTSGLSHVRWNKLNPNILASAHDQQVEVWDIRKNAPMTFITAHPNKISSIDWSGSSEWFIVTAGMDGAVKLWDVKRSRICQGSVATGSPVVRAAYLPNNESVLVLNSDAAMKVYNAAMEPTHALMGTRDVCTDFAIQANGSVVAWSRDSHLCIWDLSCTIGVPATGASSPTPAVSTTISLAKSPAGVKSFTHLSSAPVLPMPQSSVSAASSPVIRTSSPQLSAAETPHKRTAERQRSTMTLGEEMAAAAALGDPAIRVETNMAQRFVMVHVHSDTMSTQLRITFPSLYPHDASPSFEVVRTTMGTDSVVQLIAVLSSLAKKLTQASRPCLRPLLSAIANHLLASSRGNTPTGSSPPAGLLGGGPAGSGGTSSKFRRPKVCCVLWRIIVADAWPCSVPRHLLCLLMESSCRARA